MHRESRRRTAFKTITWRITATLTTMTLVYIFTGRIGTAVEIGFLEVIAKMIFYYGHERIWHKVKYGKEEIPSFVLWITGIPRSGKSEIADKVSENLQNQKLRVQRLDGQDVRHLFPETGFSRQEVNNHVKRVGHLASMLEKNGIITIASFVSPYAESRNFVRSICKNYLEVYLDTSPEYIEKYDHDGFFQKAREGKIKNVAGVDVSYEFTGETELIIDMRNKTLDDASREILKLIHNRLLKNNKPLHLKVNKKAVQVDHNLSS